MRIIWARGKCTVADILEDLPEEAPLAYSTVLTTVRILEDKGYLRHEKEGRAFVYEPIVKASKARRDALRYVMDRFFNNSAELLVANVLEEDSVTPEVVEELRKLLESESQEHKKGKRG